jgi:hypothetical protein
MSEDLFALPPTAPARRRTRSRTTSHRERRSARFERRRERRIYRLTDRLEQRRDRLADRREHLMKNGHRGGLWTRLRHRLLAGSERLELLEELLLIRWNRFLLHLSTRWERIPGPASRGGAVVTAGVSLTLAIAMVVMLPLEDPARIDSGPAPIVQPRGTGLDIGATREAPAPSTAAVTWEAYANGDLGYRFSYPSDWTIEVSSRATVLSDTADRVVVTFLRAPSGRLATASDQLLEQITAPFSGSATVATETTRTEQGYPSRSVGGTARDAVGTSIRFVVITIGGPDGNHAIVVRFPIETEEADLNTVLQIIGSFRLDRGA